MAIKINLLTGESEGGGCSMCYFKEFYEKNEIHKMSENIAQLKTENAKLKAENEMYKNSIIANLDHKISNRMNELLDRLLHLRKYAQAFYIEDDKNMEHHKKLNRFYKYIIDLTEDISE